MPAPPSDDYENECAVCLNQLDRPVETPCGHRFCWECLQLTLRCTKTGGSCPLCRQSLNHRAWLTLHRLELGPRGSNTSHQNLPTRLGSTGSPSSNLRSPTFRLVVLRFGHEPRTVDGLSDEVPCAFVRLDSRSHAHSVLDVVRKVRFVMVRAGSATEPPRFGSRDNEEVCVEFLRPPFEIPFDLWPEDDVDVAMTISLAFGMSRHALSLELRHQIRRQDRQVSAQKSHCLDVSAALNSANTRELQETQLRHLMEVQQETGVHLRSAFCRINKQTCELRKKLETLKTGPSVAQVLAMNRRFLRPAPEVGSEVPHDTSD